MPDEGLTALKGQIALLEARLQSQQELLEAETRRRIELEERLAALQPRDA